MGYSCTLYNNSSDPNVIAKTITALGEFSCDFKQQIDVENPTVYVAASAAYDKANYMYIPEFGRYYFCKAIGGTSQTITFECTSDPLMSFAEGILAADALISRNPWRYDLYLPDSDIPIESRTVKGSFKFPITEPFNGDNNCYILTTLGSGSGGNGA